MRAICLVLVLAAPARAEVDFDRDEHAREDLALISTCFNAAQTWETAQDCVNLTYALCIERLGREATHPDEAGCNRRELELWQHLLAIQTRKIEAWTVLKDNEIAMAGQREPFAHASFLRSLHGWESYQRAQCAFILEQWSGGTIGITEKPHCQMDLTVERLFELRPFVRKISTEIQP